VGIGRDQGGRRRLGGGLRVGGGEADRDFRWGSKKTVCVVVIFPAKGASDEAGIRAAKTR